MNYTIHQQTYDDMQLRRERHVASVLNNGDVLITGGSTELCTYVSFSNSNNDYIILFLKNIYYNSMT